MRKTALKRSSKPLKRSKLRIKGISTSAQAKRRIQALLREIAILTYKNCVIGTYLGSYNSCNKILQAEHLNSRANSRTFADLRNIVLLCQYHHIFFKPQHSRAYWEMIEKIIGSERWEWLKRVEQDRTPHKPDWKLEELALQETLRKLKAHEERDYRFNP